MCVNAQIKEKNNMPLPPKCVCVVVHVYMWRHKNRQVGVHLFAYVYRDQTPILCVFFIHLILQARFLTDLEVSK